MDGNDSTLDKDAEIIGKLAKEIKILKKTIKEFRKNKVSFLEIKEAEAELYRLKNNLSYHRIDKKYKFLNMMMTAPLPNFRTDVDAISINFDYFSSFQSI